MIEKRSAAAQYVQFSHYQQFPELFHAVFTRHGGYSTGPYAGLNTSAPFQGEGDRREDVIRNRQLTLQTLGIADYPSVTLWQVHGSSVAVLAQQEDWRSDWAEMSYYERPWTPRTQRRADALITQQRGIAIVLSFADCTPILLYDPVKHAFGLAHGGWRGTARGIAVATVQAMTEHFGSRPSTIYAGIGPAIGACCYEVSTTVHEHFLGERLFDDQTPDAHSREIVRTSAVFSRLHLAGKSSLRLDLWQSNRQQLLQAGLLPKHIELAGICTRCHTDRFFSHRGEHGKTGRFPVIMALHMGNRQQ